MNPTRAIFNFVLWTACVLAVALGVTIAMLVAR